MTGLPSDDRAAPRRRLTVLTAVVLVAYAALFARAVQIQSALGDDLLELQREQSERIVALPGLRGAIVDRDGQLLAASEPGEKIAAHEPTQMSEAERRAVANAIAPLLERPRDTVYERLRSPDPFVWIQQSAVSLDVSARMRAAVPGEHIRFHPGRKRTYPTGAAEGDALAAAYLGFSGIDDRGLSGIEQAFDDELRGRPVARPMRRDGRRRALLASVRDLETRRGATLVLALDRELQFAAERELTAALARTGATRGTLIALDPATGDVLAAAEAPGFDPNRFWRFHPRAFTTHGFVSPFEPGSTLKPITLALAYAAGRIDASEEVDCENGRWSVAGHDIHDTGRHGALNLRDVLRVSSNICTAKIVNRLSPEELTAGLARFGFGRKTASGFPGERGGIVPALRAEELVARSNVAFGQGLSVTAIQLAAAAGAIANGGWLVTPRLALGIRQGAHYSEIPSQPAERVISEHVAQTFLEMMRSVVESGTGHRAAVPGYAIAGKTGTAQISDRDGYSKTDFVASFLGIAPADEPRIVVVVTLERPVEPHTGGEAAAPVFAAFAAYALAHLNAPVEVPEQTPPRIRTAARGAARTTARGGSR